MTTAAVIGMGTMGPGMAATLARGGLTVRAFDTEAAQLEKAPGTAGMALGVLEKLGMPDRGGADAISYHDTLADAVAGCDLVLESVPEKADIKRAVFADLDKLVSKDCILASNTSGIPVTTLQEGNSAPGRVVGMHWSNPPFIIPGHRGHRRCRDVAGHGRPDGPGDQGPQPLAGGGQEGRAGLRREPHPLRDHARGVRSGGERRDRARGPRYLRLLGYRLQARRDRTDVAARYGRPRHLPGGGQLPERGSLQPR